MTVGDLDWAVVVLARRRGSLVAQAPLFWRPAPDAAERHRKFLEYLLTDAGAFGYRTEDSLLIAAPRGDGWLIDDAHVLDEQWLGEDGAALWSALAADVSGDEVRFVCPTREVERARFARQSGLNLAESWWLLELDGPGGGQGGLRIDLSGAAAETVEAPPVYAPPGPVLFLPAPGPADAMQVLTTAIEEAPRLGCPAIVVRQTAHDNALVDDLTQTGFHQHCDYYTGTV